MVLLFPIWVVLAGAPCVYAAVRYTGSRLGTLFVSLPFLMSGTIVLLSFFRFSGTISVAYCGGLLLLEVSRLAVLASFLFMICSIPFVICFLVEVDEQRLAEAAALVHILIFCALGSFFAAGLFSFVLLFEAVPFIAFTLVALQGGTKGSPYQHLLYFTPFPLLLFFAGLTAENAYPPASGYPSTVTFHSGAIFLFAGVLACRLLFFPFGKPALQCLPLRGSAAVSYGLFSLPSVALFALLKFVPYSRPLGNVMLILAALSMIAWVLLSYRQRKPDDAMLYLYLAQTATVATMVIYPVMNSGPLGGASLLVLGNHLVSGLGMLVCLSADETKRGRFGNGALMLFIFFMLGLPPSPGFFGRLTLFKACIAATDLPGYLLRLSFLVNLVIVYCQSRALPSVIEGIRTGSKSSRPLTVALLLLGGCLLFGMLFTVQVKNYLTNI